MKKNEQAVELLAEIIEPAIEIFTDDEVIKALTSDTTIGVVKVAMKNHPTEIVKIIAAVDGIKYEDADYTAVDLITKCVQIANDKDVMGFFISQVPTDSVTVSGSVTETTGETGEV